MLHPLIWFFAGVAAVVVGGVILFHIMEPWYRQWQSTRKRKLADAGGLRCEETREECLKRATTYTPRGYFCDDHQGLRSVKHTPSGRVEWAHSLNWTLTTKERNV
jgi:hypothetical protein